MPEFPYQPILEHGHDDTSYRRLDGPSRHVRIAQHGIRRVLAVDPEALRELAAVALDDVSHLLRASHLAQLARILDDPEASDNDRFVALELLTNANIAAGRELPGFQDTGTPIVVGYKAEDVYTGADDARALSHGIYDTYQTRNLRYSQMAPLELYTEKNTGTSR